jgi:threonine dehydratase
MRPEIKVIAVEPENADDTAQSFHAGRRMVTQKKFTVADGLRTNVGELTFPIIQRYVDHVVTVSEEAIITAMRTIWETMKIVIEASAAVPYAAIAQAKISSPLLNASPARTYGAGGIAGKRAGIILTGGNVDLDMLPWK